MRSHVLPISRLPSPVYLSPVPWSLLHTPPLPGVDNMAVDAALLDRARRTGAGVVRVYTWTRPTVSLGRHQAARDALDTTRAAARGIDIVRRLTGGRAVLHHREITYSVTAPTTADRGLRGDYAAINALLLSVLRDLGVDAELAPRARRMPPPGSAPCFELPAPGELVVGGRKLVGSAQWRDEGAWLQHGSILVHDDQPMLREVSRVDVPVVPAATLSGALGRDVGAAEFADVLATAVRGAWDAGADWLDPAAIVADAAPHRATFADADWTWRR